MLEIIAMTKEDAIEIEKGGANRIELVSALTEGGLTPSYAMIEAVVQSVNIPVNVMLRHHSKSFIYSDDEIKLMIKDIEIIKHLGANGIVFGSLNINQQISISQLEMILDACDGLEVTFHKAVDETDVLESIKILSNYPQVTNVLTAGGITHITENTKVIKQMIKQAKHLNILLGGGLTLENVSQVKKETGATNFHFGTAVRTENSPFGEIDGNKLKQLNQILLSV